MLIKRTPTVTFTSIYANSGIGYSYTYTCTGNYDYIVASKNGAYNGGSITSSMSAIATIGVGLGTEYIYQDIQGKTITYTAPTSSGTCGMGIWGITLD